MAEEQIILAVSKYLELYNKGHKTYKDTPERENICNSPHSSGELKVGVLRSHVKASFLFYTQELNNEYKAAIGLWGDKGLPCRIPSEDRRLRTARTRTCTSVLLPGGYCSIVPSLVLYSRNLYQCATNNNFPFLSKLTTPYTKIQVSCTRERHSQRPIEQEFPFYCFLPAVKWEKRRRDYCGPGIDGYLDGKVRRDRITSLRKSVPKREKLLIQHPTDPLTIANELPAPQSLFDERSMNLSEKEIFDLFEKMMVSTTSFSILDVCDTCPRPFKTAL
ncbi:DIAP2 protein, partial [Polyodon spathula]|nr:DIAP2 protein [Polyodon spathula]